MAASVSIDPAALDALLSPYDRTDAPGFAVGVAINGRPLYRRGVGLASVELPVALSPTIRMRIGSTTKHFCCLAIMLLAEEGRLSIGDSPRRILPELPDWAEGITLRQLMSHTSGMRDSLDLVLLSAGPGRAAAPDMQFGLLTRLRSVNAPPGATWNYNNGGYVLLTEIVARVSGIAFADFLHERIFAPIGMHDTLLRPLDTALLPNSATLHVPAPGGGWTRGVFGTPIGGEGGIVSTVDDMLRWLRHMDAPVIGSGESWAEIHTPLTTHGYGLGLFIDRHRGLRRIHHGGTVIGGASQMVKLPDHGLDIIVMSNGHSSLAVHTLTDAIIAACIPNLGSEPAEDAGSTRIAGTFYSAATGRMLTLAESDGKQVLQLGPMMLPMRRENTGAWSVALLPSDLRLRPILENGVAVALEATEFGARDELRRVADTDAAEDDTTDGNAAAPAPTAGLFVCNEAGISAAFAATGDGISLVMGSELGEMRYHLRPVARHLWEARAEAALPLVLTLEFDAAGFRLSSGRTTRLRFHRAA